MTLRPGNVPRRIGLLADVDARRHLGDAVRAGLELPPAIALSRVARPQVDAESARWDGEFVRELLDEAMTRFDQGERTAADAWLAPRLHATIRMTRAEAAAGDVWNFLALLVAPDYIVWRHAGKDNTVDTPRPAPTDRFSGAHYKQAFARLWWAAELFRDGDDYGPAELACRNQDMLNSTLRMEVIDHRPVAQAFTALVRAGVVTTGREVNALVTAVNATATTLHLDLLAPDEPSSTTRVAEWIRDADVDPPAPFDSLPPGPYDGRVPEASVETLTDLFAKLFREAPVRG